MHNSVVVLIMLLSTLGPSIVVGFVGYGAIKSVGRNPSAAPRILLAMIVAFLFAEGIAVMALLLVLTLFK